MFLKLIQAWDMVHERVGCQDSSCLFKKPKGMATNGGCRCFNKPGVKPAVRNLYKVVEELLESETTIDCGRDE